MIRTQYYYVKYHAPELTLIVNPTRIPAYVHKRPLTDGFEKTMGKISRRLEHLVSGMCHALYPFIIPSYLFDNYSDIIGIENFDIFKKVHDLVHKLNDGHTVEKSQWYQNLYHQLQVNGFTAYKKRVMRDKRQLDHFFNTYVMETVESMRQEGYLTEKASDDVPLGIIGRNGEIYKTNKGRHRFCFARALGVTAFPIKIIGVHGGWLKNQGLITKNKNFDMIFFRLLKEVERANA